jgi:hypothetical protein
MPNLIEICKEKIRKKTIRPKLYKSLSLPHGDALPLAVKSSLSSVFFTKKKIDKENLQKSNIEKRLAFKTTKYPTTVDEGDIQEDGKKVLLNFSKTKLIIEDLHTNLLIIKLNYKKILLFTNSMLNQQYFCLAYNDETDVEKNKYNINCIKVSVLFTPNSQLIDELIKEFAKNLTNLNYELKLSEENKLLRRTCQYCPLQQYVQLCEHLNELLKISKHEKIYLTLNKIINNINEKDFIKNLSNEFNIKPNRTTNGNIEQLNQLLCAFIYKICYYKQLQHLHLKPIDEKFNILNHIYDIDDNTRKQNCLKRKFDKSPKLEEKNNNKVIKLRKERFSLGNIYSKSKSTAINSFLQPDMALLNLLSKRKSSTFDGAFDNNNNNNNKQPLISVSISTTTTTITTTTTSPQYLHPEYPSNYHPNYNKRRESMRRSIFNKVIGTPETPLISESMSSRRKSIAVLFDKHELTTLSLLAQPIAEQTLLTFKRFKTRDDIRQFWRKVISEQILLIKMDHENKKLKAKAKLEHVPRRRRRQNMAFSYDEVEATASSLDVLRSWRKMMKSDCYLKKQISIDDDNSSVCSSTSCSAPSTPVLVTSYINFENALNELNDELETIELEKIRKLVLKGVPQINRDTVWLWLAKQYILRNQKLIQKNKKNASFKFDLTYAELLKDNTTIHQHAIMIDLGRTFPNHPHFSQQFGAGQLALFNVLKAYSILDPEVGYCQGLSFIVGVLLIHCDNDEERTFELLKHLLINLGLRKQFKPDMFALQKYMYEITRLVHDNENILYQHLEDNEASAQLYCAPWFLTLFSSQFEMGFVARVFDFLFTEGPIILFKTSLAILNVHKALLMHCDSFEVIINYLKITVPEMSLIQTEVILNKAFMFDIQRDLDAYEIEFYIFQEEVQTYSANNGSTLQLPPNITIGTIVANNNLMRSDSTAGSVGMEKRGSTASLYSCNSQFYQLENINLKLKERVEDLLEQLQIYQGNRNNQDDLVYKLQHENEQLKCKVETLEIERMSLLNQLKNDRHFD